MIGHEKTPPGRRGKPFLSYVRASLRYGTKVKRKYYKSNFDDPKFYPRILLVDELLRDDFRTLVVVSDGLRVLEAVENAFQGVVEVVAHGCEIDPDVELKRPFDVEIPIMSWQMPEECLLIRLQRSGLGE